MALYARPRPTTGIKALGCLCALAAVGLSALYPLVLFGASWTLGKVDEAMMVDLGEPSRAVTPASYLIAWTTIYSFILTALCFGAAFCFAGIDRWLTKDAPVDRLGFCGGLVMLWRVSRRWWWCGCDGSGARRRRATGRRGWRGGGGCGCTSSPIGRWRPRGSSRSLQGPSRQNGPRACRGLPGAWAAAPA